MIWHRDRYLKENTTKILNVSKKLVHGHVMHKLLKWFLSLSFITYLFAYHFTNANANFQLTHVNKQLNNYTSYLVSILSQQDDFLISLLVVFLFIFLWIVIHTNTCFCSVCFWKGRVYGRYYFHVWTKKWVYDFLFVCSWLFMFKLKLVISQQTN